MRLAYLIKQKSYEKIEHVLRRHPITFIPYVFLFLLIISLPVGVYFMVSAIFPIFLDREGTYVLAILLASAYYLVSYVLFYTQFVEYYLDMWIVTNDRIVDIEQLGLFARSVSELDLFRIQDVTTDVHGFFSTIFHYGDVTVKTASSNVGIVFRNVPNPNKVREDLIRLSHEDRKYHFGG
ncbi:PH domain-containing protein [Patescibacteria group bacterium]|nr:PH domain-containing protein [Patescibacteria group bacterium]MBU1895547.1 PH domain-containing protein [Patescibacteria group bacterium]